MNRCSWAEGLRCIWRSSFGNCLAFIVIPLYRLVMRFGGVLGLLSTISAMVECIWRVIAVALMPGGTWTPLQCLPPDDLQTISNCVSYVNWAQTKIWNCERRTIGRAGDKSAAILNHFECAQHLKFAFDAVNGAVLCTSKLIYSMRITDHI